LACTKKPNVCLITEFVERGSLFKILHNHSISITFHQILQFALDTCKGMAYLHNLHIIHRDLKSHNLLVDKKWTVKVADFGLSRVVEEYDNNKMMTACGTPCWTAPEIIRNEKYTLKVDVYSFAICFWEMLSRQEPYAHLPPFQVVTGVADKNLRPDIDDKWPSDLRQILSTCWDNNPDERPNFDHLVETFLAVDPTRTLYPRQSFI